MDNNIEQNLIQTIASSELQNISEDFLELGLDSVMNEGILKDIPVIGSITKMYSFGLQINGRILEKKILKFFFELNKINEQERRIFVTTICSDTKRAKKLGEHLLILLDRIDDMQKPRILAKIFSAYIEEKIDYEMFLRLSSILDKSFLSDLLKLSDYNKLQVGSFTTIALENIGLVNLEIISGGSINENGNQINGNQYYISKLGKILLSVITETND
jgi:hypothetical protein